MLTNHILVQIPGFVNINYHTISISYQENLKNIELNTNLSIGGLCQLAVYVFVMTGKTSDHPKANQVKMLNLFSNSLSQLYQSSKGECRTNLLKNSAFDLSRFSLLGQRPFLMTIIVSAKSIVQASMSCFDRLDVAVVCDIQH